MDESLVVVEKLHEGRLWILTFQTFSREATDAWADAVQSYWAAHPDSTDRYLIYDVGSVVNFGLSPYLRKRIDDLNQHDRAAAGRIAIVTTAPAGLHHVLDTFVQLITRRMQPHLQVRLFRERNAAIAWVEAPLLD